MSLTTDAIVAMLVRFGAKKEEADVVAGELEDMTGASVEAVTEVLMGAGIAEGVADAAAPGIVLILAA